MTHSGMTLAENLPDRTAFQALLDTLHAKRWVVYSEPPVAGPETVVDYLARYVYRVAISNSRLVRMKPPSSWPMPGT